jgi:hypothetical protein
MGIQPVLWEYIVMKIVKWMLIGGFALIGLLLGGTMIETALEHAGMVPGVMIRPEFAPTTKEVIKMLLVGELILIAPIAVAWAFWRYGE